MGVPLNSHVLNTAYKALGRGATPDDLRYSVEMAIGWWEDPPDDLEEPSQRASLIGRFLSLWTARQPGR